MFVSKPVAKQPRLMNQNLTPVTRTESVDLRTHVEVVEKSPRTTIPRPPTSMTTSSTPMMTEEEANATRHPKGHKVRPLEEVWKAMDSKDFLHLTDSLTLGDVLVHPIAVETSKGAYTTATFREIVHAPHIKFRDAKSKISLDDLVRMLYLVECQGWDLQNHERQSYDDWLKEKSAACVNALGMEEASNRSNLCNYIINNDPNFTYYPQTLHGKYGIFIRKICYHSYPSPDKSKYNLVNPAMIKCGATRGEFEYVLEARIVPLPDDWYDAVNASIQINTGEPIPPKDVPESQGF